MNPTHFAALWVCTPAVLLLLAPYVLALVSTVRDLVSNAKHLADASNWPVAWRLSVALADAVSYVAARPSAAYALLCDVHDRCHAWFYPNYHIRVQFLLLTMR